MAKLNWQRVQQQSKAQSLLEQDLRDHAIWKQKLVLHGEHWIIGKYKGKKVKELPIQYLCFVSETFSEGNVYKQRADKELHRRYRISTQG